MSLKSWAAEFYPVPAQKTKKQDAAQHSLTKWLGLQKAALKKHKLMRDEGTLSDAGGSSLEIDADSCALCWHYFDRKVCEAGIAVEPCTRCPLYTALDGRSCCANEARHRSPYDAFVDTGNAQPMIRALRKTVQLVEQAAQKRAE